MSFSEDDVLARKGRLFAVLAKSPAQRELAYILRHQIFCEEKGALSSSAGREVDQFDAHCQHILLVCMQDGLIGTCRLLPQEDAKSGFYSASEFAVRDLIVRHPDLRFLELGRSCIAKSHRSGLAASLMWQAIWNYARKSRATAMIGCASFEGTDPSIHREALSFLAAYSAAPEEWEVKAVSGRGIPLQELSHIDTKKTGYRSLPPLLKGYVRLGAYVGPEAVIDHEFRTLDVFVVLPVNQINPRYFSHYGEP